MPLAATVPWDDVNGAGGQRAVVDPAGVRGPHRLGELADEGHPAEDVELLAVLEQVLVEAEGVRVVVEDEAGPAECPDGKYCFSPTTPGWRNRWSTAASRRAAFSTDRRRVASEPRSLK